MSKSQREKNKKSRVKVAGLIWTVLKKIGKGGYGSVFLVTRDNEFRALKVLQLNRGEAKLELHLCGELQHAKLVKVYEVSTGVNHGYILMEYCPLGDLGDYLGFQRASEAIAGCLVQ